MSKRLSFLVLGVLAIALIAAGCGGGGDDDSTAAVTKAQFLKEGNAICSRGNERIEADFEKFAEEKGWSKNKEPSKAELTEASETILIPQVKRQIAEIAALEPPEGEEDKVESIVDSAEAALEEVEDDPSSAAVESGSPFEQVNKESREFGLTVCGEE